MTKLLAHMVFVMGMHRSGTSAVTGVLSKLGYSAGKNLVKANAFNAEGYWENKEIIQFHDRILERLGSSWQDIRAIPPEKWTETWVSDAEKELVAILDSQFENESKIVIKDPRMCRLFPLWQPLFKRHAVQPKILLIGRHPVEVGASLSKRDHFSKSKSLLLWIQHNLLAEQYSREFPRMIWTYKNILNDPLEFTRRTAHFLELPTPTLSSSEIAISSHLQHTVAHEELVSDCLRFQNWADCVWDEIFISDAVNAQGVKNLDETLADYCQWSLEQVEEVSEIRRMQVEGRLKEYTEVPGGYVPLTFKNLKSLRKKLQTLEKTLESFTDKNKNPFKQMWSRLTAPGTMRMERKMMENDLKSIVNTINFHLGDKNKISTTLMPLAAATSQPGDKDSHDNLAS